MEYLIALISFIVFSVVFEVVLHFGKIAYQYWKTRDVTIIINGEYVRIYDEKYLGSPSC